MGALAPISVVGQNYNAAYYIYLSELSEAQSPQQFSHYTVFSYQTTSSTRANPSVGIAFAHENWRTIYPMQRNNRGVYFYVMNTYALDHNIQRIEYRLVVDGIWRGDPANPNVRISNTGARISQFHLTESRGELTSPYLSDEGAEFIFSPYENPTLIMIETDGGRIYFDRTQRLQVYVAGSFNGWDPYLTPLSADPTRSNVYRATLKLPPGRYYYYYIVNGRRILDPHNTNMITSTREQRVSVITIE